MPDARSETKSRFFSPLFVVTALLLVIIGAGLRPTLAAVISHYGKTPIDPRLSLLEFDTASMPSFTFLPDREGFGPISKDDELGTDEYFEFVFKMRGVNTRARSDRNVMLFVTYYSDPEDQIPHTPEVCYRQAGGVVEDMRTVSIDTPNLAEAFGPEYGRIEARMLDISSRGLRRLVTYVICHNGKIFHDRERTRLAMGIPGDKRTYFSKVEAVTGFKGNEERDEALERSKVLIAEALEVLLRDHYPTREQIQRRQITGAWTARSGVRGRARSRRSSSGS